MEILDKLFFSDGIEIQKQKKLIKALKKGKKLYNYFILFYEKDSRFPLEFIAVEELQKDYYKEKPIVVVGLTSNEDEAFNVTSDIIHQLYKDGGDFYNRDFFTSHLTM